MSMEPRSGTNTRELNKRKEDVSDKLHASPTWIHVDSKLLHSINPIKKIKIVRLSSDWNDASDAVNCAQKAMSCAQSAIKELKREKHMADAANRDEKSRLKRSLHKERRLRKSFQGAVRDRLKKLISLARELDATLAPAQHRAGEANESMSKSGQDMHDSEKRDQEPLGTEASIEADMKKLVAEQVELKRKAAAQVLSFSGEKAGLQSELNAAQIAIQAMKTQCNKKLVIGLIEKKDLEGRLVLVEGERDAALLELYREKALVMKECEDRLTTQKRLADVNIKLQTLTEEKHELATAHRLIQRNLEEEKERNFCQICLEVSKDTILFPCLHFHYCFSCLEKHRKRIGNTCPHCRTNITGVLRSNIST